MALRTQIKAKIKKIEKQTFTLDINKLNSYLILNIQYTFNYLRKPNMKCSNI